MPEPVFAWLFYTRVCNIYTYYTPNKDIPEILPLELVIVLFLIVF